jgi:signal transduction histidine kinase
MTDTALAHELSRWHAWRRPLFWKLFAADAVLVGITALIFPGEVGERLIVMIAALIVASLVINLLLTPVAVRPFRGQTGGEGPAYARLLGQVRQSLRATEDGRAAVARRLRDRIGQDLAALGLQMTAAIRANRDPAVAGILDAVQAAATRLVADVQAVAEDTYPGLLAELGLVPALTALRSRVVARSGLAITLHVDGVAFPVPVGLTSALLRVTEEALDNVQRHAVARSAEMRLKFDAPAVMVEISDDGTGFDVRDAEQRSAGIGLFRARELLAHAGGSMQIVSSPGSGTRILATGSVLKAGPQ